MPRNRTTSWNKGKTLSPEHKEKIRLAASKKRKPLTAKRRKEISLARLEYLYQNPGKVPFLMNHSSKESYPERLFREELQRQGVTGWVQEHRFSIYKFDFAFPKKQIDIEIDGSTHLTSRVKKIDKRRDEFSKSKGWKVIRFTATEVKNDTKKCVAKVIKGL